MGVQGEGLQRERGDVWCGVVRRREKESVVEKGKDQ